MNKAAWKQRALDAEAELFTLTRIDNTPPPTIDTLSICWSGRTVTFRGRTVTMSPEEPDCIAFAVTNGTNIYFRDGR